MMNIAIISKSLKNGGAERAAANLSKDLSEKYNVFLFLFDATDVSYPYSGTIVDLKFSSYKSIFGKIKFISNLKLSKRKYKINISISFMPQLNLYNVLARCGDKCITSIRNTMSVSSMNFVDRMGMLFCARKADCTVSLSEGAREDLINNFHYDERKTITIYNSCDRSWFMRENPEVEKLIKNFDFSGPVLSTAGRLTFAKGQWHLLRALSLVVNEIPDCKLVIFGKGDYEERLKEYALKLGIENNVFFLGYIKSHHRFLEKCTAFVFPSIYEGLGNVLLEALACGLPTISSNCLNGPSEILEGRVHHAISEVSYCKYGILVPEFSYKDFDVNDEEFEESDRMLATAIIRLLTDKKMQEDYKYRSLLRIKDFAPEAIKGQWYQLLDNI